MPPLIDMALFSRDGQLTAVAEVKNRRGTSGEWAAELRRNILAHGGFPQADFFLMVTPDRLYLWKPSGNQPDLVEPAYEIDARPIFAPYFERSRVDPRHVSGPAFELVVDAWLADLMRPNPLSAKNRAEQDGLSESGFLAAIRDGRIEYETAA
jgi:hypothetical protein